MMKLLDGSPHGLVKSMHLQVFISSEDDINIINDGIIIDFIVDTKK